ncbi:MAG: NUDIX hydrolase [Thermodesulfobacteriota bacterium]
MIRPWPLKQSRIEVQNRIFTLCTKTAVSPLTGREHDFYILEAGDWVNVLPLTKDDQVLLVRQFRHGTREVTLEIPGGLIEPGQTPEQAAARELLEETGHAGRLSLLGRIRPNPAILNNWCYAFLARDVEETEAKHLDESEDLELVKVPLEQVPALIARGVIDHALVLSAFFLLGLDQRRFKGANGET